MINVGSTRFECETLFLQPTWSCGRNCSGCYVKEKESKFGSDEIDLNIWRELILGFANSEESSIKSSQITLALDTLPLDQLSDTYDKMYSIAQLYKSLSKYNKVANGNIKYHLTVNCINDLEKYSETRLFEGLDMISVSNINSLDDIKRIKQCAPHTKINWNLLSSTFMKMTPQKITEILTHVNQMYLLLPKAPLGEQEHDFKSFWNTIKILSFWKTAETEPNLDCSTFILDGEACKIPRLTDKIIPDGCIRDGITFKENGTGCASNISRFQIWPDGRVTGCAYNSHEQYGKKVESLSDIIDNLFDARTRYEFNHCTIPNMGLTQLRKD